MQLSSVPTHLGLYRALVTSVSDPTTAGRIRTQCPQISGTAELNWAIPINPLDPVPAVGSIVWVGFNGGDLTKPVFISNSAYITNPDGFLIIRSPYNETDQLYVTFNSGTNPYLLVNDLNGTSSASGYISGAWVKTNNTGTAYTWQSPVYAANWANGTGFAGLGGPVLRYRKDAEDNVWLYGQAKANAGAGTTVFTLPATYFNPAGALGFVGQSSGGAPTMIGCAVDTSGNVVLSSVTSGDTYLFEFRFPLGNIS